MEAGEQSEAEMGGFGGVGREQWSELVVALRGIDTRIAELTKATVRATLMTKPQPENRQGDKS